MQTLDGQLQSVWNCWAAVRKDKGNKVVKASAGFHFQMFSLATFSFCSQALQMVGSLKQTCSQSSHVNCGLQKKE